MAKIQSANQPTISPIASPGPIRPVRKPVRRQPPLKPKYTPPAEDSVSWVAAILTIVIIAALALIGYFVYSYFSGSNFFSAKQPAGSETTSTPNPEDYQVPLGVTVDNPAQQDPTAAWLMFTMPNAAAVSSSSTTIPALFSIKYPAGLKVTQNSQYNYLTLNTDPPTSTQLVVNWNKTTKNLKDYLKDVDLANSQAWEGQPAIKITTSTDGQFNGWPAVVREQKLLAADLSEYIVYFKTPDTVYSLGLIAPQLDQGLVNFFLAFVNNFRLGQ